MINLDLDSLPPRLEPPGAVEYLYKRWGIRTTTGTLAWWRCQGRGPRFHKAGPRINYTIQALDEHAESKIGKEVSSTSELAGAA